jgi:DeoR/GlpR family transcriptional regulator of sugar metabolism
MLRSRLPRVASDSEQARMKPSIRERFLTKSASAYSLKYNLAETARSILSVACATIICDSGSTSEKQ